MQNGKTSDSHKRLDCEIKSSKPMSKQRHIPYVLLTSQGSFQKQRHLELAQDYSRNKKERNGSSDAKVHSCPFVNSILEFREAIVQFFATERGQTRTKVSVKARSFRSVFGVDVVIGYVLNSHT